MKKYYLAIDIGASSGRHILGSVENGKITLKEIWRFENRQVEKNGHVCWDIDNLRTGILRGLKECGSLGITPETVGIDTWAVDYVLLDGNDQLVGDVIAYRDSGTQGMDKVLDETISPEELYGKMGIQKQPFNTVYQLLARLKEHPEQLQKAQSLLMIPDYFNFLLTGVKKQEYTNATTTNLVLADSGTWDYELIEKLGFPKRLFGELSMPGTVVGSLREEIRKEVGFDTKVILPATHDTGSAFLAVPVIREGSAILSSGTWSLLGVENEKAVTDPEAWKENFTNEGGAWKRYRFLKNIMGLWIIQQIRRELNGTSYIEGKVSRHKSGKQWSFTDLSAAARECEGFASVIDVNDERFMAPESMIEEIEKACAQAGEAVPQSVGELMQCVYSSLSNCYRDAVKTLEKLTGKSVTAINIIGGGCQDQYLNERTAQACGVPVYAGPVEGTALGNLVVQMISGGEFGDLAQARKSIFESFDIKTVTEV